MTVTVKCRTNLDFYKAINWPKELACCPRVGEEVWSIDGTEYLVVVKIAHKHAPVRHAHTTYPYVDVELHYDEILDARDRYNGRHPACRKG